MGRAVNTGGCRKGEAPSSHKMRLVSALQRERAKQGKVERER